MKKLLFLLSAVVMSSLILSSCSGDKKEKESLPYGYAPTVQPVVAPEPQKSDKDKMLERLQEVLKEQQKDVDIINDIDKIAENQRFLRGCNNCEEKRPYTPHVVKKRPCPTPVVVKPTPCCVEKPIIADCVKCKMHPFPSEYKKYSKWELLDQEGCYGFQSPFVTGEIFKFKTKESMHDFWYGNANYFGKYTPNNF